MPAVSIIIPVYESHDTIVGCLNALRGQSLQDFEIIVVDSSASCCTQKIMPSFPEARYVRYGRRLLPHAARNLGIQSAGGEIIVSTDPDVYPAPDWLERLVECHRRTGYAVAGSVTCFGKSWADWGIHFCKYHGFLPYRPAGPVGSAPSANLLFTKEMYEAAGRFKDGWFCADYFFTSALVAHGYSLLFEPRACVSHHHNSDWRKYVVERYTRGKDFGQMRAMESGWLMLRRLLWLAISVLPVRLACLLTRTARTAQRGDVLRLYLLTLPAVALGFAAWLAGEAAAYAESLLPRRFWPSYRRQFRA